MQLIGMLDSPYVRRVAVTMIHAGLPFAHRPISLFRHIDEYVKLSPLLKAPSLIADDGTVLVESGLILDYASTLSPRIAAMRATSLPALRLTGVASIACEKSVQFHYERALRGPGERSESWTARVVGQMTRALEALEAEVPGAGWIDGGEIGIADISVACAYSFTQVMIPDIIPTTRYPRLAAFAARAEALPAFQAAPAEDGAVARSS